MLSSLAANIYVNKFTVRLLLTLCNNLLLSHDYPILSSNFSHQGKTTNSITYIFVPSLCATEVLIYHKNLKVGNTKDADSGKL